MDLIGTKWWISKGSVPNNAQKSFRFRIFRIICMDTLALSAHCVWSLLKLTSQVLPQETLPTTDLRIIFKARYVDIQISSSFKPVQMHLVLIPTESDRFLTFHQKPAVRLHVELRCVSIASQHVAAFCGHRNGCLKERVTNIEKWFIHGKGCWLDGRNPEDCYVCSIGKDPWEKEQPQTG